MAENVKIRCHVCSGVTEATERGILAIHNDRHGKKICYGSFSPVMTGMKGEFFPGELVYKVRGRFELPEN